MKTSLLCKCKPATSFRDRELGKELRYNKVTRRNTQLSTSTTNEKQLNEQWNISFKLQGEGVWINMQHEYHLHIKDWLHNPAFWAWGNPLCDVASFPGGTHFRWGSYPFLTFIHITDTAREARRLPFSWWRCSWRVSMKKDGATCFGDFSENAAARHACLVCQSIPCDVAR